MSSPNHRHPRDPRDPRDPFSAIDRDLLGQVAGGASRVTARTGSGSNEQLTLMLTQVTESIKSLAQNNNQNDPMQMLLMMMMMGGMGGASSGAAAAPPPPPAPPAPPVINIATSVRRHDW